MQIRYLISDSHFIVFLEIVWATFKEIDGKVDSHEFEVILKIIYGG